MKIQSILVSLVVINLAVSCAASGRSWWSGQSRTSEYEMEILVNGVNLPVYSHSGTSYVPGRIGERYVIRVHNHSWRRVEAVISVDGRDVIDGKETSLSKRGYIIPAYSFIDVDGFRISMDEVAAFRFTTIPNSYSARMGTPWKVGVIGVAMFPEKVYRHYHRPLPPYVVGEKKAGSSGGYWDDGTARDSLAQEEASPRSRNLGTEFGERQVSPVSETQFVRQSSYSPSARLSLRYDDEEGLCAMGISGFCYPPYPPYDPWQPPYEPYEPPRQFSQPPPGWEHFSSWY